MRLYSRSDTKAPCAASGRMIKSWTFALFYLCQVSMQRWGVLNNLKYFHWASNTTDDTGIANSSFLHQQWPPSTLLRSSRSLALSPSTPPRSTPSSSASNELSASSHMAAQHSFLLHTSTPWASRKQRLVSSWPWPSLEMFVLASCWPCSPMPWEGRLFLRLEQDWWLWRAQCLLYLATTGFCLLQLSLAWSVQGNAIQPLPAEFF